MPEWSTKDWDGAEPTARSHRIASSLLDEFQWPTAHGKVPKGASFWPLNSFSLDHYQCHSWLKLLSAISPLWQTCFLTDNLIRNVRGHWASSLFYALNNVLLWPFHPCIWQNSSISVLMDSSILPFPSHCEKLTQLQNRWPLERRAFTTIGFLHFMQWGTKPRSWSSSWIWFRITIILLSSLIIITDTSSQKYFFVTASKFSTRKPFTWMYFPYCLRPLHFLCWCAILYYHDSNSQT